MELFLNLCWLSLLLPAWLLWRSRPSAKSSPQVGLPIFFLSVLAALVLLFPVISASDDLHAMRPEMEESERAFRHNGRSISPVDVLSHTSQPALLSGTFVTVAIEHVGAAVPLALAALDSRSAPALRGRAPPSKTPASL
jgi:hypothetical protein